MLSFLQPAILGQVFRLVPIGHPAESGNLFPHTWKGKMKMSSLATVFEQMTFVTVLWLFYCMVVMHEFEEWNIDQIEQKHFEGVPIAATDRSARMVIAFVSMAGLIWCSIATFSGDPTLAAWIFFPAIAFMLLNALQHIFWSFYFRKLAPGVITSALLIIPFGSFVVIRAIGQGYVPAWYAVALGVVIILGFAQTAISGSRMTALIRSGNQIGIWLSDRIG